MHREIKNIAVIGAGPCGIGATRALLDEKCFNITVFEQRSQLGGLWNHTAETEQHKVPSEDPNLVTEPFINESKDFTWPSAVYDTLDANIPVDMLAFSDKPMDSQFPLFPTHYQVLSYLKEYGEIVKHLIKFATQVLEVKQLENLDWSVITRPVLGSEVTEQIFDAVIIASGFFNVPYIPNKPGLIQWSEKFPKSVTHSKSYRNAGQFKDEEKILIVGNSASGGDLAYQLATNLDKNIYKSSRSPNLMPVGRDSRIIDVGDVALFEPETKSVLFKDGVRLKDVTKVIFATGYLKSVPFLKTPKESFSVVTNGLKLHGFYRHLLSYEYPGLAVVGLPQYIIATRLAETQGAWLARVFSNRIASPTKSEMQSWEESRRLEVGGGKEFHELQYPQDIIYLNKLNDEIWETDQSIGHFPKKWDPETVRLRTEIKYIKEEYIEYTKRTGERAKSYEQLNLTIPEKDLSEVFQSKITSANVAPLSPGVIVSSIVSSI